MSAASANASLLPQSRRTTVIRWPSLKKTQARISCKSANAPTKRRKVPSVRLGGRKRRGFFLVRVFKRLRLRWLRLHYSHVLRKLKALYSSMVKDLIEAGATIEAVQRRIMLDAYFTVPIMPMSVAVPSHLHKNALI